MSPPFDNALGKSVEVDKRETNDLAPADDDHVAQPGVRTVETTHKVYGRYSKWALFISLGLAAYIYSLDRSTTSTYLSYAASEFNDHSLISSIEVAQGIIIAVGKPIAAKIADLSSHSVAYMVVLVFYVVGFIVIASANNIQAVASGIILYAFGTTGVQILTQIIVADITTLRWRGLVNALISLPFVINVFVGSNVASAVAAGSGWRWGYGMFAILIPVSILPIILTLLWAENKARKLGIVLHGETVVAAPQKPVLWRLLDTVNELDVAGLLLLGTSISLILLPLTFTRVVKSGWDNASIIVMLVVGCVLIPVFVFYEFKFAQYPVAGRRFVFNRSVVIASVIGAFDFATLYLTLTYLYSFILVVKPWSLVNTTYFILIQVVGLTFFAIVAGVAQRFLRRCKSLLIIGLGIRLLGAGLMIHSRGANGSDAELVWTQLLQGIGGGFAATAFVVGAQASVPHADVGMVTAIVLLMGEIGASIGSAIAGAIWTNLMPDRLLKNLPNVSDQDRGLLFGSIVEVMKYERGTPIREGVIQAYDDVMKIIAIVATVLSVFPFLLSFFMPDWYLGDSQNAVENVDLGDRRLDTDGGPVNDPERL